MNQKEIDIMYECAAAECKDDYIHREIFILGWKACKTFSALAGTILPGKPFSALMETPGKNLPVSPAVLTKHELIAAMCLQGLLAKLGDFKDDLWLAEKAVNCTNTLLKLL